MKFTRRTAMKTAGTVGAVGLAGCLGGSGSDTETEGTTEPNDDSSETQETQWFEATLEDVRTGDSFRLNEFDQPVLVQSFAVWCSTCDEQERQVDTLRADTDEFVMVSINVDPEEDAQAVREHAASNGYDWQWVIPPTDVTRSLVEEFGASITHPPNAPMVLLCPDGSFRRLEDGIKSPETLESALGSC